SLNPEKGFILTDIALPPEIQALRKEKLAGQKEAEKSVKKGAGYADTILAIIKRVKEELKTEISFKKAQEVYENQRGLETIGATGANVTFIATDIRNVLATLNIGGKK
ncbi:hypothetical protein COV23_01590, partial [Candidatus Wolfebacteria bacterium CG10_big_fil_rev_8_21_14_0_10_31_9]